MKEEVGRMTLTEVGACIAQTRETRVIADAPPIFVESVPILKCGVEKRVMVFISALGSGERTTLGAIRGHDPTVEPCINHLAPPPIPGS